MSDKPAANLGLALSHRKTNKWLPVAVPALNCGKCLWVASRRAPCSWQLYKKRVAQLLHFQIAKMSRQKIIIRSITAKPLNIIYDEEREPRNDEHRPLERSQGSLESSDSETVKIFFYFYGSYIGVGFGKCSPE